MPAPEVQTRYLFRKENRYCFESFDCEVIATHPHQNDSSQACETCDWSEDALEQSDNQSNFANENELGHMTPSHYKDS